MNDIERDIFIGAGIEGYRAYQATGDPRIAGKAALSGGATIIAGALTGFVAFCGALGAFGAFTSGQPGYGLAALLLFAFSLWITITIVRAHNRRMNRYMAPQPIPAPPGQQALNGPSSYVNSIVPRQGQQYTYDVTTGQYHKHW